MEETKKCSKCEKELPVSNFGRDRRPEYSNTTKYLARCKICARACAKESYHKDIEATRAKKRAQAAKHIDKHNEKSRKRYWENVEEQRARGLKYAKLHRAERNAYERLLRHKNPTFRIKRNVKSILRADLKQRGIKFNNLKEALFYLGYSFEELRAHLESQFETWMTWGNYGYYNAKEWDDNQPSSWSWQIDHKNGRRNFEFTTVDSEEFKKCWCLENLRPFSAKRNISWAVEDALNGPKPTVAKGDKFCIKCAKVKSFSEFSKTYRKTYSTHKSKCKECSNLEGREFRKKNPELARAKSTENSRKYREKAKLNKIQQENTNGIK